MSILFDAVKVDTNLFLGSLAAAKTLKTGLERGGIDCVLTLMKENAIGSFPKGITHKFIEVADPPLEEDEVIGALREGAAFIADAKKRGRRVLVHCFAGRSRSVSVVLFYLVHHKGVPFAMAFESISRKRIIFPDEKFVDAIMERDHSCYIASSAPQQPPGSSTG